MSAPGPFWSQLHDLVETVSTNGERVEVLKGAIYDFRAMKSAEQTRLLLEVNFALLALQELSLLLPSHVGVAQAAISSRDLLCTGAPLC